MTHPKFSVVIPTRDRADTLAACLKTCLHQQFDDYEVVVCDNHGSPATREVVDRAGSPKVRYFRTERPLAMSANWEFAVAQARGEYVTVLGDDDGLMPFALRELARLADGHGQPAAIRWNRAVFTWPTMAVREDANYLLVPLSRTVDWWDAPQRIRATIDFLHGADHLPMIYNSVIRRDLIDDHRRRVGRVFPNIYPDIYTGFGFGWLAGTFLSCEVPMNVAGLSGRSNGVATLAVPDANPIADEFNRLNREFGYLPHPRVPDLPINPVHTVDSFEYAKQFFFPDDDTLTYDRRAMTVRYLSSVPAADPAVRAEYRAVIRGALDDRPDLQEWFDREAPDPPPCPRFRMRPDQLGYDGACLRMDTARLGIQDVAEAVALAADLLGFADRPIPYNLPHYHQVLVRATSAEAALGAAAAEIERHRKEHADLHRRLFAAQQDAALRNLPRKVARKVLGIFGVA